MVVFFNYSEMGSRLVKKMIDLELKTYTLAIQINLELNLNNIVNEISTQIHYTGWRR